MKKEGVPAHCGKCNYDWSYKGKSRFYATCPMCKTNVKLKGKGKKNDGQTDFQAR